MSDLNEKPTFGASIMHKEQLPTTLLQPQPSHLPLNNPSFDSISPCSTNTEQYPSTKKEENYDPISLNPRSAFYSHPRTRTSFAQAKSESKINLALYSHDLESGSRITHASIADAAGPKPPNHVHKDDKVWPCSKTREKTLLARQRAKGCSPFSRLSKKQMFWVQVFIALVVIGAITGLAVGISKAYLIWKRNQFVSLSNHPRLCPKTKPSQSLSSFGQREIELNYHKASDRWHDSKPQHIIGTLCF